MPRRKRKKVKGRDLYRQDVELPRGPDGQRRRVAVFGKTVAELEQNVAKRKADVADGIVLQPSRQTVATFLTHWLEHVHAPNVKASTADSYRQTIAKHIAPRIGRIQVNHLSALQVQAALADMVADGASASKRRHVYAVLSKALGVAVKWDLLPRNPCDAVDPPRVEKTTIQALSLDEAKRFLAEAESDRLYALYVLAVTRGLRQGEMFGLEWADIEGDRLVVQRTLTDVGNKVVVGPPKTDRSRRRVDLPRVCMDALDRRRSDAMREGLAGCDLVFPNRRGGFLRRQNVQRRSFKPLLKRSNCPEIRFHDLRHTCATLLLSEGTHPKLVQELLGHATIATTLDLYSHLIPTLHKESAETMDRILGTSAAANTMAQQEENAG